MDFTKDIKQRALQLGFDIIGVTDASPIDAEQKKFFLNWLKSGYAGQMDYMLRNFDKRINPARLLNGAQTVIVVGLNYTPPERKEKQSEPAAVGRVVDYAQYEDYHTFIKRHLRKLVDFIRSVTSPDEIFKIFVDSAPLAERALAARAGLGFIGKNHMLINPVLGPQIFLGEIVTTVKLKPDEPFVGFCSECSACIEACPTGALRADGQIDASRCISYLTIEHKGQIAPELVKKIDDRVFGCDECIQACHYQHNAPVCTNKHFKFYPDRATLPLSQIMDLTQYVFNERFSNSPIKHSGLERLKRNALICLDNIQKATT